MIWFTFASKKSETLTKIAFVDKQEKAKVANASF